MMENIALRKMLTQTLIKLAEEDERIVVVTSDARGSALLGDFVKAFPKRMIEAGIAEQNEVSLAAGLSIGGYIPFVCAPAPFIAYRACEQVKIDMGYSNTNVKAIGISGGLSYGTSGYTHYAVSDLSNVLPLSNMTVLLPADEVQMASLIRTIAYISTPVYLRIGRNPVPRVYNDNEAYELGKAKVVTQGKDLTICSAGETLFYAVEAARRLAQEGISTEVLDLFCAKPLDEKAIIESAKKTRHVLVVEEHSVIGGIGSRVCQILSQQCPTSVACVGLPDEHLLCGSGEELFHHYGLDDDGIVKAATSLLSK